MSSYLIKSTILHFAVFLVLYIFGLSWFQFYGKDKVNVVTPSSSIRVDIVSMPKLTLREQKQLAMAPFKENVQEQAQKAPAEEAKPQVEEVRDEKLQLEEEKKKTLEDLLKGFSKREIKTPKGKAKEVSQNTQKWAGPTADDLKGLLLAGNKLSKGAGITGSAGGEQSDFSIYLDQILNHIRPFWKLPGYLAQQNLKCRIRLFLSKDGALRKAVLYEGSGVDLYDEKALEATRQADPFPAPPDSITDRIVAGEIILGFPI